ncbi:MAG: precorrin-6A reductase [Peptococcaceae bacterium]|nr:precorrin-6A reductase [Peptococcaceae bacterium]
MILVLSGAKESEAVIVKLLQSGHEVSVLATSPVSQEFAQQFGSVTFYNGVRTSTDLAGILQNNKFRLVLDISHPFAGQTSSLLKELCTANQVLYARYMRSEIKLPEHPLIHAVYSWQEAAERAAQWGNTVFLTTGSNNLECFLDRTMFKYKRVVVRVLPDHRIIKKCQELGIEQRDIVAMQGPFSREMNKATFKAYKASVIVTKDSGRAGGLDTKISAALALKIPVIVIKRQPCSEDHEFHSVQDLGKILRLV